ncbi:MAG: Na+/H+ antiporter NhaC [Firmicutes bacterium]|nr:Na+/H+ antiporter NhaC [Bacillota bacterium]
MNAENRDFVRAPKMGEALLPLFILVASLSLGIIVYKVDPQVPMFLGVTAAAAVALRIGYPWEKVEGMMIGGIVKALQSIMILLIIGILIGVWLNAGVVPSMIFYGLKVLRPGYFLTAAVLICSVTSLATGSSWGTVGTIGVALMGISAGLGIDPAMTAGAILSGAYFGDKTSPMSDSTNLAAAMAGCDIVSHVKFMLLPTGVTYGLTLVFFTVLGAVKGAGSAADMSSVGAISSAIEEMFTVSPLLLLPIVLVIAAIALKVPAIPGLVLGVISGGILGMATQKGCTLGTLFDCGLYGFRCESGIEAIDSLLTTGGIMGMMYAVSMAIIAMMFSGIMTGTGMLSVIVSALKKRFVKGPASLVALTEASCILSNMIMPDQYIAIVVPGSMYSEEYRRMGLHPVSLSNALDSAGAVTSAMVPWNTCGVYISSVLGLGVASYGVYSVFNWSMPIVSLVMAYMGLTVCGSDRSRLWGAQKKKANAAGSAD